MKKILLTIFLYAIANTNTAQVNMRDSTMLNDYYLQKSIIQKRTGFNLLGFGAGFLAIGGILTLTTNDDLDENSVLGALMVLGGGVTVIASIPFFISSRNNLKKANSIDIGLNLTEIKPDGFYKTVSSHVPGVSIKIGIK